VAPGEGLAARVVDCSYAGAYRRYLLQHLSSAQRFVVHQSVGVAGVQARSDPLSIGDSVGLTWDGASLLRVSG
jgi:hypothetical protein